MQFISFNDVPATSIMMEERQHSICVLTYTLQWWSNGNTLFMFHPQLHNLKKTGGSFSYGISPCVIIVWLSSMPVSFLCYHMLLKVQSWNFPGGIGFCASISVSVAACTRPWPRRIARVFWPGSGWHQTRPSGPHALWDDGTRAVRSCLPDLSKAIPWPHVSHERSK